MKTGAYFTRRRRLRHTWQDGEDIGLLDTKFDTYLIGRRTPLPTWQKHERQALLARTVKLMHTWQECEHRGLFDRWATGGTYLAGEKKTNTSNMHICIARNTSAVSSIVVLPTCWESELCDLHNTRDDVTSWRAGWTRTTSRNGRRVTYNDAILDYIGFVSRHSQSYGMLHLCIMVYAVCSPLLTLGSKACFVVDLLGCLPLYFSSVLWLLCESISLWHTSNVPEYRQFRVRL